MSDSILDTVKQALLIPVDYDVFDPQVVMYINSAFSALNQIGLGPEEGFVVTDNTQLWSQFIGNEKRIENLKVYVCVRARLLFDPPTTAYLVEALQGEAEQALWRLSIHRERWGWDNPQLDDTDTTHFDGGTP